MEFLQKHDPGHLCPKTNESQLEGILISRSVSSAAKAVNLRLERDDCD